MWYFWPDLAFDLVKGLVAGGASLALQAVAPMTLRAFKRRMGLLGKSQENTNNLVNDDG